MGTSVIVWVCVRSEPAHNGMYSYAIVGSVRGVQETGCTRGGW